MRTNAAERFWRELRVDRIWEGTSEIQRLIVANGMVKRGVERVLAVDTAPERAGRPVKDLAPLFRPRSVALVGASSDPMKWGGWFAISLAGQAGRADPALRHPARRRDPRPHGRAASLRELDEATPTWPS